MKEFTGWLFDLYAKKDGIVLWLLGDDHRPHSFTQPFQITFYIGGPFHRLRQCWKALQEKPVSLRRTQRTDLHEGSQDVMEVSVLDPLLFDDLFREINRAFPDLLYYDTDIPLILRYVAKSNVFPLGRCKLEVQQGWIISKITPLDTPWELDPQLPDLRVLEIRPDSNPSHALPGSLSVHFDRFRYQLSLDDPRRLLSSLNSIFRQFDPDVILTSYGDTWLFSYLEKISAQTSIPFNPNRDLAKAIHRKKEISFVNYGQAHYRAEQVHLFGRWHVDDQNCMTYADYGLTGAIEQARVTGLPVQEMSRRSPGAGIAAMQTLTAVKKNILVPYQQQKGEVPKTCNQLVASDRGGLVFEPLQGVFPSVAIIDFMSMYPSVIVEYNISSETVGVDEPYAFFIPEMGLRISSREGLIPATLRPMVEKRIKIKRLLKKMEKDDERYLRYKAIKDALKWLCVVAYGRLGFANSTFGRINSHEVVSFIGRKMLLKAKEIAEDRGFTVLHAYVDSLFIRELNEYRVPSPVARAAIQLQANGKEVRMGQHIQFVYTRTSQGVTPWDLPEPIHPALIDTVRYKELLFRAAHETLQPLGVSESVLKDWIFSQANYLLPRGYLHDSRSMPLFASLKHLHVDLL